MKTFRHYLYLAAMLLVGVTMGACSEDNTIPDDDPVPANDPTIALAAGEATDTTLSFTITPEYADEVRYAWFEAGEELPDYTDLIASATVAETAAKTYQIKDLSPETTYVIVAAAAGNGKIVGEKIEMTTEATPEVPITVAIELTAGDVKPLSLSFTYAVTDALSARWAAYEKGTPAPSIDAVISTGNELDLTEPAAVVVREDIKPETTYVIMGVATDGKHKVFHEVELTTPKAELTFTQAYKIESASSGQNGSYIQFAGNADYVLELDFYHFATNSPYLIAGTYTYDPAGSDMAIGAYSQMKHKDGENTLDDPKVKFSAGTVVVEITPEKTYKFTFDLALVAEGDETPGRITGSYAGAVDGIEIKDPEPEKPVDPMPEIPADAVELPAMTDAAWVLYDTKRVSLSFMDKFSNPTVSVNPDLAIPQDEPLEPGLYSIENGLMLASSWMDSYDYGSIDEGDVTTGSWTYVAKDDKGVYTIDIVLVSTDGTKVHTRYVGSSITEMPTEGGGGSDEEYEVYPDFATGRIIGGNEVYLQFYDGSASTSPFILTLDLYTEAGVTTLPVGEYFFGETKEAWMLDPYSYYEGREGAPYETANGQTVKLSDGFVFVDYVDGAWMIEWEYDLLDGTYMMGGFNGQIEGLSAPTTGGGDDTPAPGVEATEIGPFSTITFDNCDMDTYRLTMTDAKYNMISMAFITEGDYVGTYSIADNTMAKDYTKNSGGSPTAVDFNGDTATGGTMTVAHSVNGWKIDFEISFYDGTDEAYALKGSYDGPIDAMGRGGIPAKTYTIEFDTCILYSRDSGDGEPETTNLISADMTNDDYEIQLSFYNKDENNLAGTYSLADGTMKGQGNWGRWSRINGVVPESSTMTLTATAEAGVYTLTSESVIAGDTYVVTCANAVYTIPDAPPAGGLSR